MEEKLFQVHWYLPTTTSSMRQSSVMRQDTKEYKSLREILTTAKARSQRASRQYLALPDDKIAVCPECIWELWRVLICRHVWKRALSRLMWCKIPRICIAEVDSSEWRARTQWLVIWFILRASSARNLSLLSFSARQPHTSCSWEFLSLWAPQGSMIYNTSRGNLTND